jgi:competence protein ComFC
MKLPIFLIKIKDSLINILFPIKCLGCNRKDEILCDNCIIKIQLNERETSENITALFDYRDSLIKKAIWELKYHHKKYLGEKLGQLLYNSLIENISELKMEVSGRAIYVIPVPVSKEKMKIRGYNQSLAIAKGFCNQAPIGTFELKNEIVVKKIDNEPQAKITNRKRRLKNIQGVFEIKNKDEVKGRTIIIIDDVTTTGGTVGEIMKILKKAGAKNVFGFTVAH